MKRLKQTPTCLYCQKKDARQLTTDPDDAPKYFCTQHHAYMWAKQVLRKTSIRWVAERQAWLAGSL